MKRLIVMTLALVMGAFVLGAGNLPAYAAAGTSPASLAQSEVANGGIAKVYWRGGWGWRGGWRPGWGWRPYGWGWGWAPYYWACPVRCAPWGCWRACW